MSGVTEIKFGQATVVLTAAASGSVLVNHGMGATPTAVLITVGGGNTNYYAWSASVGATQFAAGVTQRAGTTATANILVNWMAIR